MSGITPNFIEFRRHVNELIKAGELPLPEDALIYAIKECQDREISYRINTTKTTTVINHNHVDEYCAAKIFFRTESLNNSDFKYLINSTSFEDKLKLLDTLNAIIGSKKGDIEEDSKDQIKGLIASILSSEEDNRSRQVASLLGGNGVTVTLSNIYDDATEASLVCKSLNEKIADEHELWGFSAYLNALNAAIPLFICGSDEDLSHWLKVETIASHNGELVFFDPVRQHGVVNKLLEVMMCITTNDVGRLTSSRRTDLQPILDLLGLRLNAHIKNFSRTLDMGVTPALLPFGNRNNKGDGANMPWLMSSFSRRLMKSGLGNDLLTEINTKMLVKLCNGSVKTMPKKEVTNFIETIKDSVNWTTAISGMNAKGRALLIDRFSETKYYRDLISRDERSVAVRDEFEL